ncbi:MAG: peptide chain release factor N(5)-glutamine methyltransferase [Rhodocyclaceae bacterium]
MTASQAWPPRSVAEVLAWGRARIPSLEARILLGDVLGWSHARIASYPESILSHEDLARFSGLVERRQLGEPVAYLVGRSEFYGRPFIVGPAVLIPRPETELLVDLALERLKGRVSPKVLDLGTGSGVLGITLALQVPAACVMAADVSPDALNVARANALALGACVRFGCGDWFDAVGRAETFDLIVANPPYVAAGDHHLAQGDLRFEPSSALTDGSGDGLDSIRRIVAEAPGRLRQGGWLLFEHGYDQAIGSRALLHTAGFAQIASWRDLAGIERVSGGEWG